jgi:hypothetical protein
VLVVIWATQTKDVVPASNQVMMSDGLEEREKPMMAKAGEGMNHLLELGPYE